MISKDVHDALDLIADAHQITTERLLKCVSIAMLKAAALGAEPDILKEIHYDIAEGAAKGSIDPLSRRGLRWI